MCLNKRFDETVDSINYESNRPLSKYPNSHTDTEIYWIKNLIRRNHNISLIKLYDKQQSSEPYVPKPYFL